MLPLIGGVDCIYLSPLLNRIALELSINWRPEYESKADELQTKQTFSAIPTFLV